MPHGDDTFLTTEQVLEYLRLNLKTVYRLINAGKLPAVRVGHQWRFRKRDLDAWLESNATRVTAPAPQVESGDRVSVLVVDDDEGERKVIGAALAREPRFLVAMAEDGPSALSMIRAQTFDVMLFDLRMPGMDGIALAREARRLAPGLALVILTAASTEASAIEAVNLGVSGYILKPFRANEIIDALDRALAKRLG